MPSHPPSEVKARPTTFWFLLAGALIVFIQTFALLSPIYLSLLLILLIALAVNPVVSRLRAWTGGRKGAAGLLTLGFVAVLGLTGWAFFGPMKSSFTELSEKAPAYMERLQKPLIKMEQQAERSEEVMQSEVSAELALERAAAGESGGGAPSAQAATTESEPSNAESKSTPIRTGLRDMFEGVIGSFTAVAFNAAQILVVLITVFFGVIFTLMNPRPVIKAGFAMIPDRHHEQTMVIMQRIGRFVPAWAGATLLGMLTIGLLVFLAMWPIFGFKDALILGLIAGVFEAVPFLGPIISAIPALLLAFGEGGMTPLWVLIAYVVIQALESHVIMPMIMAHGLKLHPLAVVFSMLLCVAAFGVLGVLVAAPMVAIFGILHDEIYRKRFLPAASDSDLDRLSRKSLHETVSESS